MRVKTSHGRGPRANVIHEVSAYVERMRSVPLSILEGKFLLAPPDDLLHGCQCWMQPKVTFGCLLASWMTVTLSLPAKRNRAE